MNQSDLIEYTKRLIEKSKVSGSARGIYAETSEFLRIYGGPNNSFYESVKTYDPFRYPDGYTTDAIRSILQSFMDYVEAGLHQGVSPQRQAQLDVVSDFLDMANTLLETRDVHPAAAAVLIGATLEEFLRVWVEAEGISLGNKKPGLETYSQVLREANILTKQDGKDITSWAGIRNHAAHGEWDEVSDRSKVLLMLQGVNLFMRKYGS